MSSALPSSLSGPEKAAVLLLCLGSEESARLLSSMSPREAGMLAGHLEQAREVDADTRRRVLEEFKQATCDAQPRRLDGAAGGRLPNANSHWAAGLYARAQTETLSQSPGAAAEREPDDDAAELVRSYDFSSLERVSRSAHSSRAPAASLDLSLLGEVMVPCRARLADLPLALAELEDLAVGDVLLLGSGADTGVELVASNECRFPCRLLTQGQRRALAVLPPRTKEHAHERAAY